MTTKSKLMSGSCLDRSDEPPKPYQWIHLPERVARPASDDPIIGMIDAKLSLLHEAEARKFEAKGRHLDAARHFAIAAGHEPESEDKIRLRDLSDAATKAHYSTGTVDENSPLARMFRT